VERRGDPGSDGRGDGGEFWPNRRCRKLVSRKLWFIHSRKLRHLILRFWNSDILDNPEGVLARVAEIAPLQQEFVQ
jgi:very-short-patch-repair endonuclease